MTRYYRDLHDRELLNQAEAMLGELHRRRLLEIRGPSNAEATSAEHIRYPVDAIVRNGNSLSIVTNSSYEPTAGKTSTKERR